MYNFVQYKQSLQERCVLLGQGLFVQGDGMEGVEEK